ncbi:MAG: helical backbone metal receptor, partial [Candidatus Bathyarchaeia archaeon]
MNKNLVIATVAIIALIAVTTFVCVYQQGPSAEQLEALHNLVDDTGYVTSMSAFPRKIVSLAPSTTEIVFALGLDEKVVGVSDYCDYPYNFSAWIAAGNMTSIGDFSNPNLEVIASLEPDLILATAGVQGETVATLRNL